LSAKSYGELLAKQFFLEGKMTIREDEEDVLGDTFVDGTEEDLDFEAGSPEGENGDVSPHEVSLHVDSLAEARAAEWSGQEIGGLE
jgi:hypothetical protein